MQLPDLTNIERMARVGRLAVLKSERRKAAEKLRDAMVPILNNTQHSINVEAIKGWLDDLELLGKLIAKEEA